jgi:molybdenum cofactor cytidylyltransferase
MTESRIAIVVLAAGASSRMGEPKLLLPLGGESLLRRAATRAVASEPADVVVVVPPDAPAWRQALAGVQVSVVEAPTMGGPVSGSLHAAIDSVDEGMDGILVVLADMVGVTTAMMSAVIAAGGSAPCQLVGSRYGGVVAPPLLLPKRFFAEIRAMRGDGVGRAVFAAHADEAMVIEWPPSALHDVDTPDDYRRVAPT